MTEVEVWQRWVHKKTGRMIRVEYVGFTRADVCSLDSNRHYSILFSTLQQNYVLYAASWR